MGWQRWAALDCRPPFQGHGEQEKNTNNNQLAGGDAWEPLGACGVTEVTPPLTASTDILVEGAAPGGLRLPVPSPGTKNIKTKQNNNYHNYTSDIAYPNLTKL